MAISGATIVVGADRDMIESNDLQGSAYVFAQQGGRWVEQQQLTAGIDDRDGHGGASAVGLRLGGRGQAPAAGRYLDLSHYDSAVASLDTGDS